MVISLLIVCIYFLWSLISCDFALVCCWLNVSVSFGMVVWFVCCWFGLLVLRLVFILCFVCFDVACCCGLIYMYYCGLGLCLLCVVWFAFVWSLRIIVFALFVVCLVGWLSCLGYWCCYCCDYECEVLLVSAYCLLFGDFLFWLLGCVVVS